MTTRERLGELNKVQRRIDMKSDRAMELEAIVNKATPTMTDMPRGSYDPHRREAVLTELIDLRHDLIDEVQDLIDEERFLRGAIENLKDDDHREVLERHYINGESWAEIAEIFGLTPRQIYRIRDNALAEMEAYDREKSD